ncbi:hypothetical protein [Risungbinella massiliensis]|uniref:hypothetical protein n=1 Tax=Risungbinella massiliensis TaxID=1329796 RepID=UPI0005CBCF0E|nr:hypothetical protein [Risungbinella massiliensis]
MERELMSHLSWIPCEVVSDEDNNRYWVRNADTTGQFFSSTEELVSYIEKAWTKEHFQDPDAYELLLSDLRSSISFGRNITE